jgi:hypothetical protein
LGRVVIAVRSDGRRLAGKVDPTPPVVMVISARRRLTSVVWNWIGTDWPWIVADEVPTKAKA